MYRTITHTHTHTHTHTIPIFNTGVELNVWNIFSLHAIVLRCFPTGAEKTVWIDVCWTTYINHRIPKDTLSNCAVAHSFVMDIGLIQIALLKCVTFAFSGLVFRRVHVDCSAVQVWAGTCIDECLTKIHLDVTFINIVDRGRMSSPICELFVLSCAMLWSVNGSQDVFKQHQLRCEGPPAFLPLFVMFFPMFWEKRWVTNPQTFNHSAHPVSPSASYCYKKSTFLMTSAACTSPGSVRSHIYLPINICSTSTITCTCAHTHWHSQWKEKGRHFYSLKLPFVMCIITETQS